MLHTSYDFYLEGLGQQKEPQSTVSTLLRA